MTMLIITAVSGAGVAGLVYFLVEQIRKKNQQINGLTEKAEKLEKEKLEKQEKLRKNVNMYGIMPDSWRGGFYDTHREFVLSNADMSLDFLKLCEGWNVDLTGNTGTLVVHCKMFQVHGQEGKIQLLLEDPYGSIWTTPFTPHPDHGPEDHMGKFLIVDYEYTPNRLLKPKRVKITKYTK